MSVNKREFGRHNQVLDHIREKINLEIEPDKNAEALTAPQPKKKYGDRYIKVEGGIKLLERQKRFCEEYVLDHIGAYAAIRAGYSAKTAGSQCSELLKLPNIRAYIDILDAKTSQKLGISKERIMLELARCAYADARNMFDRDGNLITDDPNLTAAICGVKVKIIPTRNGNIVEKEYKLVDKNKSAELLAKLGGFLNDRLDVNVKVDEFKQIEIVDLSNKSLFLPLGVTGLGGVQEAEIMPDLEQQEQNVSAAEE